MYIHIVSNQVTQTYELIYKLDRSGKQCSTLCTAHSNICFTWRSNSTDTYESFKIKL